MSMTTTSYPTDAYLVIYTASTTMILASGEELEEVTDKYSVPPTKQPLDLLPSQVRLRGGCKDGIRGKPLQ